MERDGETARERSRDAGPGALDLATVEAAYIEHRRLVSGVCRSYLGNVPEAEDAVQETFLRAARRLDVADNRGAYLCAVARSVCWDVRHSRGGQDEPLVLEIADGRQQPEEESVGRLYVHQVWGQLTQSERRLFACVAAGMRHHDIARLTGMSAKSVSVLLCRARKRVRQLEVAVRLTLPAVGSRLGRSLWRDGRRRVSTLQLAAREGVRRLCAQLADLGTPLLPLAGAALVGLPGPTALVPGAAGAARAPGAAPIPVQVASSRSLSDGTVEVHGAPVATATAQPGRRGEAPSAPPALLAGATPENSYFYGVAAAPSTSGGGEVFALGAFDTGVPQPFVFHSVDGGATWESHRAPQALDSRLLGESPPQLLVAVDGSRPVLLVMTAAGLFRSDDGGRTAHLVTALSGPAALVSSGATAGAAVDIATPLAVWTYDVHGDALHRAFALPVDLTPTGISPDGRLVVGNTLQGGDAVVAHCTPDLGCSGMTPVPGCVATAPGVTILGSGGVVLLCSGSWAFSRDGGATFHTASSMPRLVMSASSTAAAGAVLLVEAGMDGARVDVVTPNGADTPTASTPAGLQAAVAQLLPGGRIVLAGWGARSGMWWSDDGGASWRPATRA